MSALFARRRISQLIDPVDRREVAAADVGRSQSTELRTGFVALKANCAPHLALQVEIEEILGQGVGPPEV